MLVLVLAWTQCLPQGAGAPPAMMRGRMTGFHKKNWGPGPPERQDKVDTICTVPLDCGTPTTRRLYPLGAGFPGATVRKFDSADLRPLLGLYGTTNSPAPSHAMLYTYIAAAYTQSSCQLATSANPSRHVT